MTPFSHPGLAMLPEILRLKSPRQILIIGDSHSRYCRYLLECLNGTDNLVVCPVPNDKGQPNASNSSGSFDLAGWQRCCSLEVLNLTPDKLGERYFNAIILALPMNVISSEIMDNLIDTCSRLLCPGGTLCCIERVSWFPWSQSERPGAKSDPRLQPQTKSARKRVQKDKIKRYVSTYGVYSQTRLYRLKWYRIHYLRFSACPPQLANELKPNEYRENLSWGPFTMARDVVNFVPTLAGLSLFAKKMGARFWYLPLIIAGGIAAFLRDPKRSVAAEPGEVLSACDGTVIEIREIVDPNLGEGRWLRIAAFLSLFNVHINRAPVAGRVIDQFTLSGGFARAYHPKAIHNHACYVVLESENGTVAVVQRVGLIARRICNWIHRDELLAQGERYGLIRMGSRTDVYLPADKFTATVCEGDKIKAGQSVIARLKAPAQS